MGFFSLDSPLYKFLSRLLDVLKLNFLWILFSLPIVTIGASTVAAYSVALKMVDDQEGYIGKSFLKAFKENWKQGIILGFITMASIYLVCINFSLFYAIESNPLPLVIVGVLASVYFTFSFIYAYPLIARYDNTIFNTLKNSFLISIRFVLRTIILLLIIAFTLLLIFFNKTNIFFGIILGPAFIIFTVSSFALRIFQKLEESE
ncbi:MAG TPA: YesL family protein [Clostridiales bacterium]|jgi:uncharacterized membrane protein YesL|nr:YesL family protein [Clostridiales bacterium]